MGSFWRRHKQKILAAAAVGAAGAAAAYWWWYSAEEEEEAAEDELLFRQQQAAAGVPQTGSSSSRARPGGRPAGTQQQQQAAAAAAAAAGGDDDAGSSNSGSSAASLDASLAQHFHSIQELSDRQALEELLPRLQQQILSKTDVNELREQLRGPAALGLSHEAKLVLWRGLASHSFTRALGSVWLVPLLDLLVRLKLHVVGRHMYLESKLSQLQPRHGRGLGAGGPGGGGGALAGLRGPGPFSPYSRMALPPSLSDRAKEEFFRCDFFIDIGAGGLLAKLRAAVERGLSGVDFTGSMSSQDVEALIITMHAAFEDSFLRGQDIWADYLVAPGPAPVSVRTASGVEALLSPMEASMVDELNGELRQTLSDYRFVEALRAAVRHTSKGMGAYIGSRLGGRPPQQQQQQPPPLEPSSGPGTPQQQQHPAAGLGGAAAEAAADAQEGGDQQQQTLFPYIVPTVAKSGQMLFEETGRCSKGISSLREVQALCASVFTFGANIC